jgi:hypothetical protein
VRGPRPTTSSSRAPATTRTTYWPPIWHVGEAGGIAAGRGMLIIDAIADEWGITQLNAGKEVWFRLPI